jgi:hypothetical protein
VGFSPSGADKGNQRRRISSPRRAAQNPHAMRTQRETAEHPFGTTKMRIGATHFLMKTLPKVATEMALCVLTYNLTRVFNIVGALAARSDQAIGAGTSMVTPMQMHLRLPRIARGDVQDDLSTNFFQLGLPGHVDGRSQPRLRPFHTTKTHSRHRLGDRTATRRAPP